MWTETMGKDKESNYDVACAGVSDPDTAGSNDCAEKVILEISVTDTGIGIPADRLPKLFKSFSQIDISTARRYGGTGLGLAISSTLVNHMGGALWVESDEGVGSCFGLTLPMTVARPSDHRNRAKGNHGPVNNYTTSPPSPNTSASDGDGSEDSSSTGMSGVEGGEEDSDAVTPSQESHLPSSATASPATFPVNSVDETSYFPTSTSPQTNGHVPSCRQSHHQDQQHPLYQPRSPLQLQPPPPSQQQQPQPPASRQQDHSVVPFSISDTSALPTRRESSLASHHSPSSPPPTSPNEIHQRPFSMPTNASVNGWEDKPDSYSKDPPRNTRSVSRQHCHAKKAPIREDGRTAQLYPMKIMLAEDNECKSMMVG